MIAINAVSEHVRIIVYIGMTRFEYGQIRGELSA